MASNQVANGTSNSTLSSSALKQWYDYANEFRVVKTAKAGYDMAKHSTALGENALNRVEDGIQAGLTNVAVPVYENYCSPATDRILQLYTKSLDTTKSAVDKTAHAASYTAALSIGLAIVATQMGISASIAVANAFLSSIVYTKQAGTSALDKLEHAGTNVENVIRSALEQTQQMAKVPAEKASEHANSFLDIANVVFERQLGLPHTPEPLDSPIGDRITFLSTRVSDGLVTQANNNVIDPVRAKVAEFAQQVQQSLILDIWRGDSIEVEFENDEVFIDSVHYTIPNRHRRRVVPLHNGA